MKKQKPQQKAEKRVVVLRKNGIHQIIGVTTASAVELCNKGSFAALHGAMGMSLVQMFPRFALYKELNVPERLQTFDGMQR